MFASPPPPPIFLDLPMNVHNNTPLHRHLHAQEELRTIYNSTYTLSYNKDETYTTANGYEF